MISETLRPRQVDGSQGKAAKFLKAFSLYRDNSGMKRDGVIHCTRPNPTPLFRSENTHSTHTLTHHVYTHKSPNKACATAIMEHHGPTPSPSLSLNPSHLHLISTSIPLKPSYNSVSLGRLYRLSYMRGYE